MRFGVACVCRSVSVCYLLLLRLLEHVVFGEGIRVASPGDNPRDGASLLLRPPFKTPIAPLLCFHPLLLPLLLLLSPLLLLLLLLLLLPQIVFSEAVWVGSPEDKPDETALPLPKELAGVVQHDGSPDYAYGAGAIARCCKSFFVAKCVFHVM
jgi:hypothetical protein